MLPTQPDGGIDASMARPAAGCVRALIPVIGAPRRCVVIHVDQIIYRSDPMSYSLFFIDEQQPNILLQNYSVCYSSGFGGAQEACRHTGTYPR